MRSRIPALSLLSLLFVMACAGPSAAQAPNQGRKFALLVGINKYEHPNFPDLKFAENDVIELAQLLKQGGYTVTLLCDAEGKKDHSRAPTRSNIDKALAALLTQCRKGDTMIVAFAGHGLQPDGQKDAFFCPADAVPSEKRLDTLISLNNLYQQLDESFAGAKVLLVDACRNDPKGVRGARAGIAGDRSPQPPNGVVAFFSCKAGEKAYEPDALKHGVFFHFVLKGLRGEAKNRKGEVTFEQLMAYVKDEVPGAVERLVGDGATQSPHLKVADFSGPSLVLLAKWKDARKPGDVYTNKLGMKFAWIPAGSFTMGSPVGEKDRQTNEVQHKVTLTRGFYMGVYPVTQKQWQEVMGDNPSYFKKGDDYPVEMVSWEDCQKFVKKLSDWEGKEYRLPTEAEWEFACRAGTTTAYYTGNDEDALDRAGWYLKNSGNTTHPVGKKEANK